MNYEESLKDFKDHISESLSKNEDFNIPNTTAYIINVEEDAFRYHYKNRPKIWYSLLYTDILKVCLNKSKIKKSVDVEDIGLIMKGKHPYYYHFYNALEDYRKKQHIQTVPQKAELKNYVLVIDEINRANLPAVLGELIYAFEYRGEQVESMYAIEGNHGFILPPNLYIIGTMNTADRSVGQIDYAIRRRFAFVDMLPTPLLEEEKFDLSLFVEVSKLFIDNYDEYFNDPASNLKPSIYLSNEFRPEDVWIGHSYFIMKDRSRHMRLKYEIIPILKEYLRDSILKESAREIIEKLK